MNFFVHFKSKSLICYALHVFISNVLQKTFDLFHTLNGIIINTVMIFPRILVLFVNIVPPLSPMLL